MIGTARRRRDGEAKVRGATRFVGDMPAHGLLHARPVLAAEAHARIIGIDTEAARAQPGVVAVLTHADLPLAGGSGRAAEPLAREEIVWAGQPVALVIAESEAAAEDGAALVDVDTEWLEPVLDLDAALADGAPPARISARAGDDDSAADAHGGGGDEARGGDGDHGGAAASPNIAVRQRLQAGDVEAGLAAADHVVRGRFRTSWVHQAYLEPQSTLAWVEPDGTLVVHSSTQGAFMTRQGLANTFGLAMEKVRVQAAPLGGAFGGKLMIAEPLAAAAALVLRRPVRIVFSRTEEFSAGNPAPGQLLELELGATADGALTAIRGRVVGDRGGLGDMGVEALSALLSAGPYRWPAHDLTALGVTTNRVSPGAYRAPGAPPAAFAVETLLDELADELDLDPIELRLKNVLVAGDKGLDGQEIKVFGARECLERVREHPLYAQRHTLPADEGVGLALGFWPGGLEPAGAICKLDSDGRLTVVTAAADMSGIENAFIAIAAEAFGLPEEQVRVVTGDTGSAPYGGVAGGSKVTYTYGRAVERAAEEAKQRLLDVAASELEIAPEDLEVADGEVRPLGAPGRAVAIADLAAKVYTFAGRHRPIEGYGSTAQVSRAPGAAAHLSHVKVDRETGEVRLLAHVIAQDVGRALNPALVEGQMHGGTAQGIGWALLEELAHTDEGQLQGGTFAEYALPSTDQVPPIETLLVEVPAPDGPFGAKGVGEPPVCGVPAAIANGIAAATDIRLGVLPMTPARVWAELQSATVV
ncbi:xanthine dehydrogenase family protein molybdopterin-binding subunit [Solirubrobacter phytolaccae]|uniref:Xanthine dehydrogenase family protein molybdopterin-binding subunit n=1 Tax=Solirubrobacter phytolaccae TaxID=1404360 RepID=A0A9X3NB25_9ACTN|nr:xanthine dehydrogenase family protein molybdopterin-binding subunit [Solirubrobacter phytolaccae]MDA0182819.1 xanthine dehydrogenase family protein molybdopterin-binding subunit [Solirubrobacter phytolaccae]